MRFNLILTPQDKGLLPINYQYEISSWIYKQIQRADREYAEFLHTQGYQTAHKHFKFFTFSNLKIPRYERIKDRLKILCPQVELMISFLADPGAEHFISGVFKNQEFSIGDQITRARFSVSRIEAMPPPGLKSNRHFKAISPVVVSKPRVKSSGKMMPEYLAPDHPDYEDLFFGNLLNKYKALSQVSSIDLTTDAFDGNMRFRLLNNRFRSRLVTIKANTPQETRVRGYLFDFGLHAPSDLMEVGLLAGFGEKNSIGFGCVEVKQ